MLNRLQFFLQWSAVLLLLASAATAQSKTITLQGSGDAGNSETISLEADANVGVTVNETGIVVTLPVNVRVKCYGDETDEGYCLLAVGDGTGNTGGNNLVGLTPSFGSPSSQTSGFTVQITNYDSAYTWSQETSRGSVTRNSDGLLTVTGLSAGQSATVTVTTTRSGYSEASSTVTGQASSAGNPSYCSGAPANVICDRSTNLDDMYGPQEGYEIAISPTRIVSMPFTLQDVGSNANQVISLETFTDQAVLAEPFKIRAWFSTTPGGYEYSAQCDGYSNIARFTFKVVQFNSSRSCSLPASGGVFYANFAVTCQFGATGCTSTSDMYQYGSIYKFFLSRYIQ